MVGFISEHVTANNAEILKWVHFRKGQKQQVSERVERASHSIARAMQALTELAFVYPYSQKSVQPQAVAQSTPAPLLASSVATKKGARAPALQTEPGCLAICFAVFVRNFERTFAARLHPGAQVSHAPALIQLV